MKQLSVIVTVYNMEYCLRRAAASVLDQPCSEHLELLLIDDGSTDGSAALCDRLAAERPDTVRCIHQKNAGTSSALNRGIREAQGEYLCFLDADDWWEPGFFDEALSQLLTEGFELYTFSYQMVSPDLRWRKAELLPDQTQLALSPDCERPYYVRHWACMIRRSLLQRHSLEYPSCFINEDVVFMHLVSSFARSVRSSSRVMLNYWLNPKSCVHTTRAKSRMDEILKSLRQEAVMFKQRGLPCDNSRAVASAIAKELPLVCSGMGYGALQRYLGQPQFALLRQDEIRPWDEYRSNWDAYRSHPRLFWLRSRINPGLTLLGKRFLYKNPALLRIVCSLRYHLRLRWQRVTPQNRA